MHMTRATAAVTYTSNVACNTYAVRSAARPMTITAYSLTYTTSLVIHD